MGLCENEAANAAHYIKVINGGVGEMFWRFSGLLMDRCHKELGSTVNDQRVLLERASWSISFIALAKMFCSRCLEGQKTL